MASGVFGSFRYGFFTLQLLRENQRATQILLEKVETLRLYRWDQVNSTNGFIPATFTEVYDPQGATGAQGVTYNGTLAIANCAVGTSYATNMRQLTVTLNWTTRDHPAHPQPHHLHRQGRHPKLCILRLAPRARRAWTLVEMMVAVGVFSLVGLALMGTYIFSVKSMASMYNYSLLDQYNRQAMDQLTREIRQSKKVLSYTHQQHHRSNAPMTTGPTARTSPTPSAPAPRRCCAPPRTGARKPCSTTAAC